MPVLLAAPSRRSVSGLIAIALGGVLLAGCSDDEPAPSTTTPPPTTAAASPTPAPATTDPALAAIATAEAAVSGGEAIAYERADGDTHLELEVVVDNRSHEVYVDLAGTNVTRTEPGEVLEADEQAEFDAMTVPLAMAIATAAAQVPGGIVQEADLETTGGTVAWDVEFRSGSATNRVMVDARTGAIR